MTDLEGNTNDTLFLRKNIKYEETKFTMMHHFEEKNDAPLEMISPHILMSPLILCQVFYKLVFKFYTIFCIFKKTIFFLYFLRNY